MILCSNLKIRVVSHSQIAMIISPVLEQKSGNFQLTKKQNPDFAPDDI